jgi:hypothetical protein
MFFFFNVADDSYFQWQSLYLDLQDQIANLTKEINPKIVKLDRLNGELKQLSVLFDPHIVISEVNTKSLGHSYMGKIRVPATSIFNPKAGKVNYLNFYLGKVNNYNGKSDQRLLDKAKLKAEDLIKRTLLSKLTQETENILSSAVSFSKSEVQFDCQCPSCGAKFKYEKNQKVVHDKL